MDEFHGPWRLNTAAGQDYSASVEKEINDRKNEENVCLAGEAGCQRSGDSRRGKEKHDPLDGLSPGLDAAPDLGLAAQACDS